MLAQNFKTPADLGLDDAEFDGLVKTLGLLEREEVEYFPAYAGTSFPTLDTPKGFNMLFVKTETECGAAACILGWARELTGVRHLFGRTLPPEIMDLFCTGACVRWSRGKDPQDIQPAEGAAALRNFLTYGEPRWHEIF